MCDESRMDGNMVTVSKYTVPGPEMTAFNGCLAALCEHRGQPQVALAVVHEIGQYYANVKASEKRLEHICSTLLTADMERREDRCRRAE